MCGFQNTSRPQGPSLLPAPHRLGCCTVESSVPWRDPDLATPPDTAITLYNGRHDVRPRDPSCGCIGVDMENRKHEIPICFCFCFVLSSSLVCRASRVLWMPCRYQLMIPLGCSRATRPLFLLPPLDHNAASTYTALLHSAQKRESNCTLYTSLCLLRRQFDQLGQAGQSPSSDLCPPPSSRSQGSPPVKNFAIICA